VIVGNAGRFHQRSQMNGNNFARVRLGPPRASKWFPLSNARSAPHSIIRPRPVTRRRLFPDPLQPSTPSRGKHSRVRAASEIQMMAYSNWKKSIMSRSFMKRHPKGKLPHSGCVVLGVRLTLTLSDIQRLDTPQIPTSSSRLPEDDKTTDVSDVPDTSDEDMEECAPPNFSTRGMLPEWDIFQLHDQLLRALHHQSFTKPTPIQSKALPPALRGRDVVGVAETVRTRPHLLPSNTYIGIGIGKNSGVRITDPT